MSSSDSAVVGKRMELLAFAELLQRGYDVCQPLVDNQQIDCIVRREVREAPVYLDVQIKARSKNCKPEDSGKFPRLRIDKPRPGYYFVFYSELLDTYWIMPSTEVVRHGTLTKTGKNKGLYTIVLGRVSAKTRKESRDERFREFQDNFDILKVWEG